MQATATRPRPPPYGKEGKLDGTNYTLWKFKLKVVLSSYELWDTVLGIDQRPGPTQDPADPSVMIQPDAAELLAWTRRDADALCAIVTSISDSVLTLIQHVSTAAEAWEILRAQYETTNQTRILNLENRLTEERLSDTESAETFLTRVKNLRDQLAAVGVALRSEELAQRCLRKMPAKYDSLVTSLSTQVRSTPLTFEDFSAILQEEELRQKMRREGEDAAFAASVKKGKGKDSGKDSSAPESSKSKKKKK